jgi:hypothetical protein
MSLDIVWRDASKVPERMRRAVLLKLSEIPADVRETMDAIGRAKNADAPTDELETQLANLMGPAVTSVMFELNDLVACALIESWASPAPVSVESLLDLPSADYDAIQTTVAPQFFAVVGGVDFDPNPDPSRSTPTTP